ncbi:hypothetical protein M8J77_009720 [Diaphorina citri]|nr:hypothetical protein M8J77_009720 [Diaphorina citri]
MGRVCEGHDEHRPILRPRKKDLADIVGQDIDRFEVYQPEPAECTQGYVQTGPKCPPQVEPDCIQTQGVNPMKVRQCMDPTAPGIVCDDLLDGKVCISNLTTSDDRCKITDPLHQKNKHYCGFENSKAAKEAADKCCRDLNTRVCADYFCTNDCLYDQTASNYFKYGGKKEDKTKCNYPFPCKAHCFNPPPRRNPLADSVCSHPESTQPHDQYSMVQTVPQKQGPVGNFVGTGWNPIDTGNQATAQRNGLWD